jgi:hypothetical protein
MIYTPMPKSGLNDVLTQFMFEQLDEKTINEMKAIIARLYSPDSFEILILPDQNTLTVRIMFAFDSAEDAVAFKLRYGV